MKIQVTQEHINKGVREHCYKCPIALAVGENFPNQEVAVFGPVHGPEVYSDVEQVVPAIVFNGYCRINGLAHRIPKAVSEFIDRFDHHAPVEPFEFEAFG